MVWISLPIEHAFLTFIVPDFRSPMYVFGDEFAFDIEADKRLIDRIYDIGLSIGKCYMSHMRSNSIWSNNDNTRNETINK